MSGRILTKTEQPVPANLERLEAIELLETRVRRFANWYRLCCRNASLRWQDNKEAMERVHKYCDHLSGIYDLVHELGIEEPT